MKCRGIFMLSDLVLKDAWDMTAAGIARYVAGGLLMATMASSHAAPGQSRIHFGPKIQPVSIPRLESVLPLSSSRPPTSLARQAEVVVVSGYQPPSRLPNQAVEIHIDQPGHRVLLVLASYEKVRWHVNASPGTRLAGILVSGYYSSMVATDLPTHGYRVRLPYAYKTGNRRFVDLLRQLRDMFGIDHVDAFRGRYELPSHVRIARMDSGNPELSLAWPKPEAPKIDFRFLLPAATGGTVPWSLTGPAVGSEDVRISNARMAHAPDGAVYTLGKSGIEVRGLGMSDLGTKPSDSVIVNMIKWLVDMLVPEPGQAVLFALPATFPRISWPEGIAYDSKRDLVSMVTLGGEGYLYRFDAKAGRWLDYRSLNNVDLHGICYDPGTDRYVAWTGDGRLLFISGDGQALFSRKVANGMQGFDRIYDSGNEMAPRLRLVARGNKVALIYVRGGKVKRIWYYDDKTRRTLLTFKGRQI